MSTWDKCGKCGAVILTEEKTCYKCGTQLGVAPPQTRWTVSTANVGLYTYSTKTPHYIGIIPAFEFDCSNLRDPMAQFKEMSGIRPEVQEWIGKDRRVPAIVQQVLLLANDHLVTGGSKWLTIGFRDRHERWISRAVANIVADALVTAKFKPSVSYNT